jgi:hypothetical protein
MTEPYYKQQNRKEKHTRKKQEGKEQIQGYGKTTKRKPTKYKGKKKQ